MANAFNVAGRGLHISGAKTERVVRISDPQGSNTYVKLSDGSLIGLSVLSRSPQTMLTVTGQNAAKIVDASGFDPDYTFPAAFDSPKGSEFSFRRAGHSRVNLKIN